MGVFPNIARNSIVNSAKLASYDQVKEFAVQTLGLHPHSKITQTVCAFISAFICVVFGSPADVIKTRLMNAKPNEPQGVSAIVNICKYEGLKAFYKGFNASFMRIGSWNIVMFLTLERIKEAFE